MLIFRPLFDPSSSTWSYLLGDRASGEAVLIDPVFEQLRRDQTLVQELGLTLKWTLETHVHADHVTGAWLLRQRLGSRIALSVDGAAASRWPSVRATCRCAPRRATPAVA
jgi:sulfur dioxygenase